MTVVELGQSADPAALIPGNADIVEEHGATLRQDGARLESVGLALGRVDVGGWQGPASQAFGCEFPQEPVKWLRACDALTSVAELLTGYAQTLRWAQAQAVEAIDLWQRGEAATARARSAGDAGDGSSDEQPTPFVDPGAELRELAREVLSRARAQLAEVASSATELLVQAGADLGAESVGTPAVVSFIDGLVGWTDGDTYERTVGPLDLLAAWEASGPYVDWGSEGPSANWDFLSEDGGLSLGSIFGTVTLAEAETDLEVSWGPIERYWHAEGTVGAEGGANAELDNDGLDVEAGGYLGLRGEVRSGTEFGDGVQIDGGAHGIVGVSAEGDVQAGVDDGKFTLRVKGSLAFGLGGGIDAGFTVDPGETWNDVKDGYHEVEDAVGDAKDAVTDGVSDGLDKIGL